MIISSDEAEKEVVLNAARLMVTAARTAPKAGGRDYITTAILLEKIRIDWLMNWRISERTRVPPFLLEIP